MKTGWILNSGRKFGSKNEEKMLSKNWGFISFGTKEERIEERRIGNNTYKQWVKFNKEATKHDNIYLYAKGIGIIATGIYTGKCGPMQENTNQIAPNWEERDRLSIIYINWVPRSAPFKLEKPPNFTLSKYVGSFITATSISETESNVLPYATAAIPQISTQAPLPAI